MDEDAIDYYQTLVEHLGKAAKYQLLGGLFAGQKILGFDPKIPAIRGKMGGFTYYSFAIQPARLLKQSYILHRNRANSQLMPTYQRLIRKSRLKRVAEFVEDGGFFPNSIILNLEAGARGLRFERSSQEGGDATLGILHLPQTYRAAYVIDGQHRLYGYANSDRAETELVPVVAFVGLPGSEQVKLFMQINENQQAVPKNLRNTLNADLLWDSEDLQDQSRALKLRIAQHLGESKTSPLFGRVIIGENAKSDRCCLTIEAINIGLDRGNFIGTFSKTELKEPGTFYRGKNQATFDFLVPYLEFCFEYVKDELPDQWTFANGNGGFVFINSGVESMLRLFSDIVDHLVEKEQINPRDYTPEELFEWSRFCLDPLVEYLSKIDFDAGLDFRRNYGSGGRTRYWRQLQIAVHEGMPSFDPPGLDEYIREQEKQFNKESWDIVIELEAFLNHDIRKRLVGKFGDRWTRDGLPRKIVVEATQRAVEKNLEREPGDELEFWDCLYLSDYHTIVQYTNTIWQEIYQDQYTRPDDLGLPGGWKGKSNWLFELNSIRNELAHNAAVTEAQYEFIVSLKAWLLKGQTVRVT
jgi:DNA sulfur modification protein DndB